MRYGENYGSGSQWGSGTEDSSMAGVAATAQQPRPAPTFAKTIRLPGITISLLAFVIAVGFAALRALGQ